MVKLLSEFSFEANKTKSCFNDFNDTHTTYQIKFRFFTCLGHHDLALTLVPFMYSVFYQNKMEEKIKKNPNKNNLSSCNDKVIEKKKTALIMV